MIEHRDGIFGQLLDTLLPRGGHIVTLWEGYFDESGTKDDSVVLCIAGYVLRAEKAQRLDAEWRRVLARYGLPYFHMVDCAHGAGVFSGLSMQSRIDVATSCIDLIKSSGALGIAVALPQKYYGPRGPTGEYVFSIQMLIAHVFRHLYQAPFVCPERDRLALFFEAGHEREKHAKRVLDLMFEKVDLYPMFRSYTFARKTDFAVLQAADLLAWQCRKYISDKIQNARPPRQDYASLTSINHEVIYLSRYRDIDDVTIIAFSALNAIEANWPQSDYIRALFDNTEQANDTVRTFHDRFGSILPKPDGA